MEELEDTMPLEWEEPENGKNKDQLAGYLILSNGARERIYYKENLIGRDPNCHVVISDRPISSKHAVIIAEDKESHFLSDLGSLNKTKIGKVYLKPQVRYFIRDGDELHFGNVRATYAYAYESPETLFEDLNNMTIPETPEKQDDIIGETPVKGSNYGSELKALISEFSQRRKLDFTSPEGPVQGCPSIFEIATQSVEEDAQINETNIFDLETEKFGETSNAIVKNDSDVFALETVKFSEIDEKTHQKTKDENDIFDVETEKIPHDVKGAVLSDQETEEVNLNPENRVLSTSLEDLFASQDVFEPQGCPETGKKDLNRSLDKNDVDSGLLEVSVENNISNNLPLNENKDVVPSSQISNQSNDIPTIPNFYESCGYNDPLIDMCLPSESEKRAEVETMRKSFEGFESEKVSSEAILDLKRITDKLCREVDEAETNLVAELKEATQVEDPQRNTDETCVIQIEEETALSLSNAAVNPSKHHAIHVDSDKIINPIIKVQENVMEEDTVAEIVSSIVNCQRNCVGDEVTEMSPSEDSRVKQPDVCSPLDQANVVDVNIPPLVESQENRTTHTSDTIADGQKTTDCMTPVERGSQGLTGLMEKPDNTKEIISQHSVTLYNQETELFNEEAIADTANPGGEGSILEPAIIENVVHPQNGRLEEISNLPNSLAESATLGNRESVVETVIDVNCQGNLLINEEQVDISSHVKSNAISPDCERKPTIEVTNHMAELPFVTEESKADIIPAEDIAEDISNEGNVEREVTVANHQGNVTELVTKELVNISSPVTHEGRPIIEVTNLEDIAELPLATEESKTDIPAITAETSSNEANVMEHKITVAKHQGEIELVYPLFNEIPNHAAITAENGDGSILDQLNNQENVSEHHSCDTVQESKAEVNNPTAEFCSSALTDTEKVEIPSSTLHFDIGCENFMENLNVDQKFEARIHPDHNDELFANTSSFNEENIQKLAQDCNENVDNLSVNDESKVGHEVSEKCNVVTSNSFIKDDNIVNENIAELSTQVISHHVEENLAELSTQVMSPKFENIQIKPVIIIDKSSLSVDKQEKAEQIKSEKIDVLPTAVDYANLAELATQIVDYDNVGNHKKPIIIDNRAHDDNENIAELATQVVNNQLSPITITPPESASKVPSTPIIIKHEHSLTSPGFDGFKVVDSGKKSKRKLLRRKLDDFNVENASFSFKEPTAPQKQVIGNTDTEDNIAELATQVVDYQSLASTSKTADDSAVFDGFKQGSGKKFKRKLLHEKLEERSILDVQTQEMICCRRDSDEFDTQTAIIDNVEKEMLDMFQQENHLEKEVPNSTQAVLEQLLSPELAISELSTQAVNLDRLNEIKSCEIKINDTAGSRVETEMLDIFGQVCVPEKLPCLNSTQAVIEQLQSQNEGISNLSTQVVNLDRIKKEPVKNCEIRIKNKDLGLIDISELFSDPPTSTPKKENTRMRTRNQGKKKEEIKEDTKKSLYKKEKKPKTIEKKTLKVKIEKPSLPEKLSSVKTTEKPAKIQEKAEKSGKTQNSTSKKIFFDLPKEDDDLPSKKPRVFTISDDEDSFEIPKPEKTLGTSVFSKTFSLGIFSRKRQIKVENSPNASSYSLLSMDETLTDDCPTKKLSKISEVSDEDSKTPKRNVSFSKKVHVKLENSPNTSSYSLINMDETCNLEEKTPKKDEKSETKESKLTSSETNLGKGKRTRTRKVFSDYETEPEKLKSETKKLENEKSNKKIIKHDKKSNTKRKESNDLPKTVPSCSEENKRKRKFKDDELEVANKKPKATESSSTGQRRTRRRNIEVAEIVKSEEKRSSRSNKRV